MALSSLFSVNGSTVVQAHSGAYGSTFTFVIQSLTGIEQIAWSILGTSNSGTSAPSIALSGTPTGQTATVTQVADPGDGLGRSFIMKLVVSNQRESSTTYRVFGTGNSSGRVPFVCGEENYRSSTHGWTDLFNSALNTISGVAGSSGNVQYNNGGVIGGASGISVVGSGAALAFGTNPSTAGDFRTKNIYSWQGRNYDNSGNVNIIGLSGDGSTFTDLTVGDAGAKGNNALYLNTKSFARLTINGGDEYDWDTTKFDMTTNYITMTQNTAPGSPASGTIRLYVDSADGKLKSKNSAGTTTNLSA